MDPIDDVLERLLAADAQVLPELETWRDPARADAWLEDARLYRGFARELIRAGHPTRGYELAREGMIHHADDRWLQYYCAQALVRGKNPLKAWEYLEPLLRGAKPDQSVYVDAHGLAGRIKKDLYLLASGDQVRQRYAREAARAYENAFRDTRKSFLAINAATMTRLGGQRAHAEELARTATELATAEMSQPGAEGDYWLEATIGEARLLLGDAVGAAAAYRKAVGLAGRRWGDVASMRGNVLLLREVMEIPDEVLAVFHIGAAVVFSGHMIDHPDRKRRRLPPRFPADRALERAVADAIRAQLDALEVVVGYASAACGGDILFGEAMIARGAELHVVLPFSLDDFFTTSVDFGLPAMRAWRARCEAVLAQAAEVHYATREPFLGAEALFGFGDSFARGLAINRAAQLGAETWALTVRDPGTALVANGTGAFVQAWQKQQRPLREINLAELRQPGVTPPTPPKRPKVRRGVEDRRTIKAMLFADVKNYSKLAEEQAPKFFLTFLTEVDRVLRKGRHRPVFQNTWGDGLYLVFNDVIDCADFALRLLDRVGQIDWPKLGLPVDTAVRMGLHAGPVYSGHDPIIERVNFFGTHVNRAARIEPVTPPGCAFASEQFAAALASVTGHELACDYVGAQSLAKDYDRCVLYRVRRR